MPTLMRDAPLQPFHRYDHLVIINNKIFIIPRARMGSESIAHEAEGPEPMKARAIIVLVKSN